LGAKAKAKAKRVFAFQTGVSRFIFLVGSKRILIYFDFFEQVGKNVPVFIRITQVPITALIRRTSDVKSYFLSIVGK
jgi:hypothetical protein